MTIFAAFGVFAGVLGCLEIGYRIGGKGGGPSAHEGVGAVDAAVFALLGLLLGFSFSGASERLQSRRALVVQEANAIGTAYLRLDLLASVEAQEEMRKLFEIMSTSGWPCTGIYPI